LQTIIHTPTPSLTASSQFYSKLGFEEFEIATSTYYSAKNLIIEVNQVRFARAGIKIIKQDWSKELDLLRQLVTLFNCEKGEAFVDPSGSWVYLETYEDLERLEQVQISVLENYYGVSLETANFAKSIALYEIIGFAVPEKTDATYVALQNGEFSITMMKPHTCPHLFFSPSLNFFNGSDNISIIEKIKQLNIPISEEITHFNKENIADNIIIRDLGGYGFFVFSD
jgi:hypothetical protein